MSVQLVKTDVQHPRHLDDAVPRRVNLAELVGRDGALGNPRPLSHLTPRQPAFLAGYT